MKQNKGLGGAGSYSPSDLAGGAGNNNIQNIREEEFELAKKVAEKLLDEPYTDPDDDLRTLARQFNRLNERCLSLISHHNTTLKEIEEEVRKEFDAFWQHNFYDKGIQFTYLGKPIIGNHRIEHPKKTIKSFLKSLIHQKLIK